MLCSLECAWKIDAYDASGMFIFRHVRTSFDCGEHLILSAAHGYTRTSASGPPMQEIQVTRPALSLDLADARRIIAAGERKAMEIGIPYNIAVADAGGGLVAHVRMDGAWLGSVDIAINKAWTARAFDMSTEELSHLTQSGQQGFGLNTTNDSRVVIFGGGIPIRLDDVVIGAVGASGGSVEQDVEVARAAIEGF